MDSIHGVRPLLIKDKQPVRTDATEVREDGRYIVDRLREANEDDSRNAWRTPISATAE